MSIRSHRQHLRRLSGVRDGGSTATAEVTPYGYNPQMPNPDYHERLCTGLNYSVMTLYRELCRQGWKPAEVEAALLECVQKAIATARKLAECEGKKKRKG